MSVLSWWKHGSVRSGSETTRNHSRRKPLGPSVERLEERLLLDAGDVDPTFGQFQDGRVITEFSGSNGGKAEAVAMQSDGKIVAVGHKQIPTPSGNFASDVAVVRYDKFGNLDTTFDGDGISIIDFGAREVGRDVVIQPDGKIVVGVEEFFNNTLKVLRLNSNGSLDSTFGSGGGITLSLTPVSGISLALQTDGKILVATHAGGFAVIQRFNSDGSQDNSFGGDSIVDYPFATDEGSFVRANDVLVQPDGKIVVVGTAGQNSPHFEDFVIARLNRDGSADDTFDDDGLQLVDFGPISGFTSAHAVTLDGSGRIVVAGYATGPSGTVDFAVVRLNHDGSQDTTFNGDGRFLLDFGGRDVANDVVVLPNGSILLIGEASANSSYSDHDFALVSLNPTSGVDTNFGNGGFVTTTFEQSSGDFGLSAVVQPDGRIVVAGVSDKGTGNRFALVRYEGAPPANDNIANARVLSSNGGTLLNQSNGGATRERDGFLAQQSSEPFHYYTHGGSSVWYSWTAPYSAAAGFAASSTDMDPIMAIYTKEPGQERLVQIANNDDFRGDIRTSAVGILAQEGTTYYIVVDGYRRDEGSFDFSWFVTPQVVGAEVPEKISHLVPAFVQAGAPTLDQEGLVRIGVRGENFSLESQIFIHSQNIVGGYTVYLSPEELEARIPATYFAGPGELPLAVRTANRLSDARLLPVVRYTTVTIQPGQTQTFGSPADLLKPGSSATLGDYTCRRQTPCQITVAVGIDPGVLVPARLIGQDGAGVVANDGAGLVGNDGASLQIRLDSVSLASINVDRAAALAQLRQTRLIGDGGGTIIGQDGASIFRGSNPIVAGGGGNIVAGGGGNIAADLGVRNEQGVIASSVGARPRSQEEGWFLVREADGTLPEITVIDNGDGTATVIATLDMSNMPVPGGLGADEGLLFTLALDPNLVEFATTAGTVSEDGDEIVFTVTRTGDTNSAVSVNFATADGTAQAGKDYTETFGTLSFGVGETSKNITIPILEDHLDEEDETILLTLSNPSNQVMLGLQERATATILANVSPPPKLTTPIPTTQQAKKGIGSAVFTFDSPMDRATVENATNYRVVTRGKKSAAIGIASAVYDEASRSVRITPAAAIKLNQFIQVTLVGAASSNNPTPLKGINNRLFDGDGDGQAGGDFTATFGIGTKLAYADQNGDVVTLQLKGGGGMNVTRAANGNAQELRLVGTGAASILSGKIKAPKAGGGDARTTIGTIIVAPGTTFRSTLAAPVFGVGPLSQAKIDELLAASGGTLGGVLVPIV